MTLENFKYSMGDLMGEFGKTMLVNAGLKKRVKPSPDVRLDGQVAIVTGGNRGIGKVISTDLASRGAKVIIACRDTAKAQETVDEIKQKVAKVNIQVCQLDLTSFSSVREFAKSILNNEPRIDILINNAGLAWTERTETEDKNELMLQVNCCSPTLLTYLLADRLSKSPDGRVVNVSALAHSFVSVINWDDLNWAKTKYSYFDVYGHSKLALMLLTRYLSKKLAGKVKVYAADPGVCMTEFANNMSTFHRISGNTLRVCARPVHESAESVVSAVVDSSGQYVPGENYYMVDCRFKQPSPYARSDEAANKLWDIFKRATGASDIN